MGSNKKVLGQVLLFLVLSGLHLSASQGWRAEVSGYFARNDLRGVYTYLSQGFRSFPETDKTTVCGLLAYAAGRLGNRSDELAWIKEYYETYRGGVYILGFMEPRTRAVLVDYLHQWDKTYPFISEIGMVKTDDLSGPTPPAHLLIGLEIRSDSFYKIYEEGGVIEGGLLNRGFNTVSLETRGYFEGTGSRTIILELKKEDLLVRKELTLDITVNKAERDIRSGALSFNIEYSLSMFWGDKLLVTSRKIHEDKIALNLDLPPGPDKFEPFKVPGQHDPAENMFSIFDALAGITEMLKNIGKDKDESRPVLPLRLLPRVGATFLSRDSENRKIEVKVDITLTVKNAPSLHPGSN